MDIIEKITQFLFNFFFVKLYNVTRVGKHNFDYTVEIERVFDTLHYIYVGT